MESVVFQETLVYTGIRIILPLCTNYSKIQYFSVHICIGLDTYLEITQLSLDSLIL